MSVLGSTTLTALPVVLVLVGIWAANHVLARRDQVASLAAARAAVATSDRVLPTRPRRSLALVAPSEDRRRDLAATVPRRSQPPAA